MAEVQRCHYEEMKEERKNPYCFTFKFHRNNKQSIGTVTNEEGEPLVTTENAIDHKEHTAYPMTFTVSVIRNRTVSVPLREDDMNFVLDSEISAEHINTKFFVYPDNEHQTDYESKSVIKHVHRNLETFS